jgi:hypothetical protein
MGLSMYRWGKKQYDSGASQMDGDRTMKSAMKRILVICFFIFTISAVCFGQSSNNESITISTYYPSPTGVYHTLRFQPNSAFAPGNPCSTEGEASYNKTNNDLYVCKGSTLKWTKFDSATKKILSNHSVSPNLCDGTAFEAGICNGEWYMSIAFPAGYFNNPPKVMVFPEVVSDPALTPCARGLTDTVYFGAHFITKNGFELWASGSPMVGDNTCSDEGRYSRVRAGWIAIGD